MTKIINGVLTGLFIIFTVVQFNDPDSWLWILMYAAVAVLFGLAVTNRYYQPVLIGGMVICLVWAIYLSPALYDFITNDDGITFSQGMSNEQPYIELSREFGGLLIAGISLGYLYFQAKKP